MVIKYNGASDSVGASALCQRRSVHDVNVNVNVATSATSRTTEADLNQSRVPRTLCALITYCSSLTMPYKGGRRKKHRTQKPLGPGAAVVEKGIPRSLVLRRGKVDVSVTELQHDLRRMMMPHTASKLQDRRTNTLRDFVDVAGLLGVTHLIMLSQSEKNVALRIGRTPRGPTLTFRVDGYTLGRSVRAAQKRPVDLAIAYETPPLVVLHNFGAASAAAPTRAPGTAGVSHADAMKMTMVTLQAMFPAINPATLRLAEARRVVLVHYNKETRQVELRHYAIRAVPVGVSRAVKKVAGIAGGGGSSGGALPDLGRLDDIAEYLLSGGGGAASDSEFEDTAARVSLPQTFAGRGNAAAQTSAIKLSELGPRLSLTLVKIEADLAKGEVLHHAFVAKSEAEAAALRAAAAARVAARSERTATQAANVARKEQRESEAAAAKAARRAARQAAAVEAAGAEATGGSRSNGADVAAEDDGDADVEDADDDAEEEEEEGEEEEAGGDDEEEEEEEEQVAVKQPSVSAARRGKVEVARPQKVTPGGMSLRGKRPATTTGEQAADTGVGAKRRR